MGDKLDWIRDGLKDPAKTQRGLASAMNVDPTAVSKLLAGKRKLSADEAEAARRYFTQRESAAKPSRELKPVDNTQRMVATHNKGRVEYEPDRDDLHEQPQDIKILGHVRAGRDGFFLDQGEVQGMAPRPKALRGVKSAFAARVMDDSMFPAYEPDDLVFVNPALPIIPNANVIIELTDGQAFIKRLIRRTEKAVICMQWNPKEEVRYEPKKIKAIYRIIRPT